MPFLGGPYGFVLELVRHAAHDAYGDVPSAGTSRSVRSSEPRAGTGIRLVSSRGGALRRTWEGDEQDVWDRARVDDVIHFARSLDERLPRAVGGVLALAAKRSVDGERAVCTTMIAPPGCGASPRSQRG